MHFCNSQLTIWVSAGVHDSTSRPDPKFNPPKLCDTAGAVAQRSLFGSFLSAPAMQAILPVTCHKPVAACTQPTPLNSVTVCATNTIPPTSSGPTAGPDTPSATSPDSGTTNPCASAGYEDSTHVAPSVGHQAGNPSYSTYEWTVRACFKKYELGTSFSVIFFLGAVPEDPDEWQVCDNFVGAVHAFVSSTAVYSANRTQRPDSEMEGFVHLNEGIAKHSNLSSFDPDVVVPYLTHNLHWRVQKVLALTIYCFCRIMLTAKYSARWGAGGIAVAQSHRDRVFPFHASRFYVPCSR